MLSHEAGSPHVNYLYAVSLRSEKFSEIGSLLLRDFMCIHCILITFTFRVLYFTYFYLIIVFKCGFKDGWRWTFIWATFLVISWFPHHLNNSCFVLKLFFSRFWFFFFIFFFSNLYICLDKFKFELFQECHNFSLTSYNCSNFIVLSIQNFLRNRDLYLIIHFLLIAMKEIKKNQ